MRVAVIANSKAEGVALAWDSVCRALRDLGAELLLPPDCAAFPAPGTDEVLAACDVAVALGGDGTIIHTAKRAAGYGRAVLGVNCGHLGFMAGLELDELSHLPALIEGRYTEERRMVLDVAVHAAEATRRFTALNEVVISRGALSRMIELQVSNHGEPVVTYHADGVIVATPTGSTAYSLSAGGPIIDPALNALLMTPICPHSLFTRSMIFHEDACLSVTSPSADREEIFLTADSEEGMPVSGRDRIVVSRSPLEARLIKIKPVSFYGVINQKLMNRR